jgi:hypothetical protein
MDPTRSMLRVLRESHTSRSVSQDVFGFLQDFLLWQAVTPVVEIS